MASEEPVVAVPIACLVEGACQRSARMETHRVWISSDKDISALDLALIIEKILTGGGIFILIDQVLGHVL